ncbi:MAG: ParB N-terminal domain-containing protein [Bryobacterales bacterium]|nr:ParB N-terminal domain-containing protein [Bryobacterales bacterium]
MNFQAVAVQMARRIEIWPLDRLKPYARNARTHSDAQVAQIAASIVEFGFNNPILVDTGEGIVAGHGRLLAARKLGLAECPVVVLDHLSETQRRAYIIADNKLALNAGWDEKMLAVELRELDAAGMDLGTVGFSDVELEDLFVDEEPESPRDVEEEIPDEPANPVTRPGDVWVIGKHRLICGDCRDRNTLGMLFPVHARANVVITSPPYAKQRDYDTTSGFTPIPPEQYVAWYAAVAAGVESVLAPDGSYFLNIKAHADEGERNLYVMDLVLAHKRLWGWRFVDDLCWRKTDNGVPGGWGNRFKNAWEPVFHFCRQQEIKFRPKRVGHESEDCFDYSPNNPKSKSGSGLLGTGARGAAADGGKNQSAWQRSRSSLTSDSDGRRAGVARPSNVIEVKSESSQGSHSAPFPRALVEFFVLAYSDPGDVVFDPFCGSGTTIAAAELLGRTGYGTELSPAYCDVIVRRLMALTGNDAAMDVTGETFAAVAEARGVPLDQALNPKANDSRAIKHNGPNPHYGSKRKAS